MRPGRLALLGLGLALCAVAGVARAQAASEAAVKAAFLYKFAGYIEWPAGSFAQADSPLVIGVSGANDVAAELEQLVPRRSVHNRRIEIRRVSGNGTLRGLHVLFVGRGKPDSQAVVAAANRLGILTITEGENGLEQGSAINFVTAEDRVSFEISLDSAERTGHRISSRMLAVARRVVPRT